ncbi:MAG TPA: alpha/beta hydrolase [Polyangia bacterium]
MPPGFVLERNVEVDNGAARPLHIHVARATRPGLRPAVAYIFGGGWESNGPDQGLIPILGLALRGYTAVSIDYRYSSEATFPAQLDDVRTCMRFLRARGARFGIDPERVGVMGLSSGGHLAALLATTAAASGGDARDRVGAVAVWAAPVDLHSLAEHHGGLDSPRGRTARLLGGPVSQKPDLVAAANPLTFATTDSPPFFIAQGERDETVPAAQARLLYEGLRAAGARAELLLVPGRGHGYLGLDAVRRTARFFDRELKGRKPQAELSSTPPLRR